MSSTHEHNPELLARFDVEVRAYTRNLDLTTMPRRACGTMRLRKRQRIRPRRVSESAVWQMIDIMEDAAEEARRGGLELEGKRRGRGGDEVGEPDEGGESDEVVEPYEVPECTSS